MISMHPCSPEVRVSSGPPPLTAAASARVCTAERSRKPPRATLHSKLWGRWRSSPEGPRWHLTISEQLPVEIRLKERWDVNRYDWRWCAVKVKKMLPWQDGHNEPALLPSGRTGSAAQCSALELWHRRLRVSGSHPISLLRKWEGWAQVIVQSLHLYAVYQRHVTA